MSRPAGRVIRFLDSRGVESGREVSRDGPVLGQKALEVSRLGSGRAGLP